MDSYQELSAEKQEELKQLQLPYVTDVARYCKSLGFWGFCGADVLFDCSGKGYLVDVNPRVTGSCPSLMVGRLLREELGFQYGLFRRNGDISFEGSIEKLLDDVARFNVDNEGQVRVVIFSACNESPSRGKMNVGVYGQSLEQCRAVVHMFCKSADAVSSSIATKQECQ